MVENKISEIMQASIDSIKSSFDANTVTGDPITTNNGTVIVPVSKLTVGFASGGVGNENKETTPAKAKAFDGAGGGAGVSLTPVAFLVVTAEGKVDLLNVNDSLRSDPIYQIISAIERSPELIEKFKTAFKSKKDEKAVVEEDK